jgi:hypothetical protein
MPKRGHAGVLASKLEKARLYLVRNARPRSIFPLCKSGAVEVELQVRQSGPRSFIVRDEETVRFLQRTRDPHPWNAADNVLCCARTTSLLLVLNRARALLTAARMETNVQRHTGSCRYQRQTSTPVVDRLLAPRTPSGHPWAKPLAKRRGEVRNLRRGTRRRGCHARTFFS